MLTLFGWIDGITATLVVFSGLAFGLIFIYKGKKQNADMLFYLGLTTCFAGLLYLGVFLDFYLVMMTGENFPNNFGEVALLSYIWFPLVMLGAIYIAATIQMPEYRKHSTILFAILGTIFYIIIFIDPIGSFYLDPAPPENPNGEVLIDYNIEMTSIAGLFLIGMLVPVLLILGLRSLVIGRKTTGDLRKQFYLVSLGIFCYGIFGMLEGLTQPGIGVIIVRFGYIGSFLILYFGLRPR